MRNARTNVKALSRLFLMGDEGLELRPVSKWKITDVVMGNAKSDAFMDVHDRKLEALLQVWADFPEGVKDALLVMVSDRS